MILSWLTWPQILTSALFYLKMWAVIEGYIRILGLPWWLSGKESAWQCRRHGFDPWFGKIPCALEQLRSCTALLGSALKPENCTCWSPCAWWPLLAAAREATAVRSPHVRWGAAPARCSQRSQHSEEPACALRSSHCLLHVEKSPCSQQGPAQHKVNTQFFGKRIC